MDSLNREDAQLTLDRRAWYSTGSDGAEHRSLYDVTPATLDHGSLHGATPGNPAWHLDCDGSHPAQQVAVQVDLAEGALDRE